MSMIAVIYETITTGDQVGTQVIVGRIRLVDGRLVGEPPEGDSVQFILGRALVRADTGEVVSPHGDPAKFLAALPAGYTGTLLRVGLERA